MASLFELHRAFKAITITDDEGNQTEIGIRALDQETSESLNEKLFALSQKAENEAKTQNLREQIVARAKDFTRQQLTDLILRIEQQTAYSLADLAPTSDEAAAIEKWRTYRTDQIRQMPESEVRELYVDHQHRLSIKNKSVNDFVNSQIVAMVVDPKTQEPILSEDPKSEKYINRLMPETRKELHDAVQEFLKSATEKVLRKISKDASFLPSGQSPKPSINSPGELIEISSSSPPAPSGSSPSGSG